MEIYVQEKWSPIKNSWISRFIFSFKNSIGLKRIAELVSRAIGIVVISYFLGFILWLFSNLFIENPDTKTAAMFGFVAFFIFDLIKYIKEQSKK